MDVGNTDESAHSTFGTSQLRCHRSNTLVAGSSPMRVVPIVCFEFGAGLSLAPRDPGKGGDVAVNVNCAPACSITRFKMPAACSDDSISD